jgi:hypothetical protein
MTDHDCRPSPPGRFHWGRVVSLAGAAGLCASFFMEHVNIKGPFVPSECLQSVHSLWVMISFCLPFLAAILLLPLLAFRAVPRLDRAPGVGKFLAVAVCTICLSVVIAGLAWMTYIIWPGVTGLGWFVLFYAVPDITGVSLVLAIIAMVRSRLPRKAAAAQFALGTTCLAYFAFFAIADFTKYAGLWLSLAASGMLAIGSAIDWFQCRTGEERNGQ